MSTTAAWFLLVVGLPHDNDYGTRQGFHPSQFVSEEACYAELEATYYPISELVYGICMTKGRAKTFAQLQNEVKR